MFLDDKLYNHVKAFKVDKPEDFGVLIKELYGICEDHWKPKMIADHDAGTISYKRLTALLDQVFNAWNLFVKKLQKENIWFAQFLADEKLSYKHAFMANEECKRIYDKGK